MSIELSDLEKKIERRISHLEQEKCRLKEDLKVVRQANAIATDFQTSYGESTDWKVEEGYEERRLD